MAGEQRVDFSIRAQDAASEVFARVKNAIGSVSTAYGTLTRIAGATGIAFVMHEITSRTIEAERASNGLNAALRATGMSAGVTRAEIEGIAQSLSKSTVFDSDEIQRGLTALLRFRDVQGDVFREAARMGPDLAAALGTDLVGAYTMLGKALQDPVGGMRGLRDAGLKLEEEQVRLVQALSQTGQKAGAQKGVLDELGKSIGGAAFGENQGLYGATKALGKAWDDLLKSLGADSEVAASRLSRIAQFIERLSGGSKQPKAPSAAEQADARFGAQQSQFEAGMAEQRASILRFIEQQQGPAEKIGADMQRDIIDRNLRILDQYHEQGLVSEGVYWDRRRELIQGRAQTEIAFLSHEIGRQSAALELRGGELAPDERISRENKIKQLRAERVKAERDAATEIILSFSQQTQAAQQLEDQLSEVNARIAEMQGNPVVAGNIRFNIANRRLLQQLPEGSPERARVEQLRDLTIVGDQFRRSSEQGDVAQQRLQNRQTEIDAARRSFAITDLEALAQKSEANRQAVADLGRVKEAMDALAASSDDPRLKAASEALSARLKDLAADADLVGQRFREAMVDPLTTFFDGLAERTKSVKDLFKDMVRSIAHEWQHLLSQNAAQQIAGLTKGFDIGSFFGFGKTSSGYNVESYATGTNYVPETGLYRLHQGEAVIPADSNRGSWGGGGININITGSQQDAQAIAEALMPVMRAVARGEMGNAIRPGGAYNPV